MTDEELLAQAPTLPVVFFDGLGAFRKVNGLLRCVGWTIDLGAQMNFVISLAGAEAANRATREVLDGKSTGSIKVWNGEGLAH
jgi:hypothetical protein